MKNLESAVEDFYSKMEDLNDAESAKYIQSAAAVNLYLYLKKQKDCEHPPSQRKYIGGGMLSCSECGKEMY